MTELSAPKTTPSYLSWSQFDSFVSCGMKYKLSYVDRVPRAPKGYFIGGHAIHATIQEAENRGWWAIGEPWQNGGEALEYFHELFDSELARESGKGEGEVSWGGRKTKEFPEGENADWWHATGPMMLRRYASLRREDDQSGFPMPNVEAKVILTPEGIGKPLIGYIDALFPPNGLGAVLTEVGRFPGLVRDYKTSSTYTPDHPLQLAIYGRAWHQLTGDLITRGQFIYLRAGDGRLVYEVDLSDWYPVLDLLMAEWRVAMEKEQYIHQPSWRCKSCDVAAYCEVGKLL